MDSSQPSSWRNPVPSPFERIIALDWYDGLKAGLAACAAAKRAYAIEFRSWDDEETRRIYTLSPFAFADFERVVAVPSGSLGPPRWPMWLPVWRFHSRLAQETAERALATLAEKAQEPTFVILTEHLSNEIILSASLREPVVGERFARLAATNAPFEAWEVFLHEYGSAGGTALCE